MIETLVVTSILGLIAVGGIYKVINAQEKSALNDAQAAVVRMMESARNASASGEGTQDHGLYIEQNGITLFEGNIGNGTKYFFHPAVESNLSGEEIRFARYSSEPSAGVTVVLNGNRGGQRTIEVSSSGAITISE